MTQLEMLQKMFDKQEELSIHTNGENWKERDIPWYRAVWTECAEMIEHTDWKWWKKGEVNLEQLQLELIDIWHFIMSDLLRENKNLKQVFDYVITSFRMFDTQEDDNQTLQESIESLASAALKHISMLRYFMYLCYKVEILSIEQLYKLYIGKNILNGFRQNHGYKQGTYIKNWNKKEDNDYMMLILKDMSVDDIDFKLYIKLEEFYIGTISNE